ncbi:hypothetical protein JGI13_01946, partial [Candidatus Kryptonium thompsonii]
MNKIIFDLPVPIILILLGIMMLSEEKKKVNVEDNGVIEVT